MSKFSFTRQRTNAKDKGDPFRGGGGTQKERETYAEAVDFVQRG